MVKTTRCCKCTRRDRDENTQRELSEHTATSDAERGDGSGGGGGGAAGQTAGTVVGLGGSKEGRRRDLTKRDATGSQRGDDDDRGRSHLRQGRGASVGAGRHSARARAARAGACGRVRACAGAREPESQRERAVTTVAMVVRVPGGSASGGQSEGVRVRAAGATHVRAGPGRVTVAARETSAHCKPAAGRRHGWWECGGGKDAAVMDCRERTCIITGSTGKVIGSKCIMCKGSKTAEGKQRQRTVCVGVCGARESAVKWPWW